MAICLALSRAQWYKKMQGYSANYSAFSYARNPSVNNFILEFKLGYKSVHGVVLILISFSE